MSFHKLAGHCSLTRNYLHQAGYVFALRLFVHMFVFAIVAKKVTDGSQRSILYGPRHV